jgi:hypothetical protein
MEPLRRTFGRVFGHHPPTSSVVDEIKAFRNLQPGWNSYRAPRISDNAIKAALEVVDIVSRRRAPLPSPAPTALGGVALVWEVGDFEAQLLIDEDSFDYSVARRAHPKVIDQGSLTEVRDVEKRFIERYVLQLHPA